MGVNASVRPAPVSVVVDELVLDGVAAGDPLVAAALERVVGPALEEHGLAGEIARVAGAVVDAVGREQAR